MTASELLSRLLIAVTLTSAPAMALDVHHVSVQGFASNASGAPLQTGDIRVEIYTVTNNTLIYDSGSDFNGAINNGSFFVMLGSLTPLTLDDGQIYFMEIFVNGEEIIGDANGGRYVFSAGSGSDHNHDDRYYRKTETIQDAGQNVTVEQDGDTWIDGALDVNGAIDLDGRIVYGALDCRMVFVECNGECGDEEYVDVICHNVAGSDFEPISVSCTDVANWGDAPACGDDGDGECTSIALTMPVGSYCKDTSGYDAIIACCRAHQP